jgi:hypothetical protein
MSESEVTADRLSSCLGIVSQTPCPRESIIAYNVTLWTITRNPFRCWFSDGSSYLGLDNGYLVRISPR